MAATANDIRSRHWYGPENKSRSRGATIVKRTRPQGWPGEAPARGFSCRTARPRRPRLPAPARQPEPARPAAVGMACCINPFFLQLQP